MSDSDEREGLKAETEEEDEEGQGERNDLERKEKEISEQEDQVTQMYTKSQQITLNNTYQVRLIRFCFKYAFCLILYNSIYTK